MVTVMMMMVVAVIMQNNPPLSPNNLGDTYHTLSPLCLHNHPILTEQETEARTAIFQPMAEQTAQASLCCWNPEVQPYSSQVSACCCNAGGTQLTSALDGLPLPGKAKALWDMADTLLPHSRSSQTSFCHELPAGPWPSV